MVFDMADDGSGLVIPAEAVSEPVGMGPATPTSAEMLGADLAASVIARALRSDESAASFARPLNLDAERVRSELAYLSIFTMHFCIDSVLGTSPVRAVVLRAFYDALWSREDWGPTASGIERRIREYGDAFDHPHPEYGRGYWTGRVFARLCGASHDVAVIELGARAYVSQLPPILTFLRSVAVV
jgi:hypothetical protein